MTLPVLFTKEGVPGWIGTAPREGAEPVDAVTWEARDRDLREALTAEGTISLASVNARRGQASIRIEQKLSPDSVPRILNALVRGLGDKRPPAEEFARLKADITDTSHYTVDLRSGFSNRVEFTRTTTLPGGSRTDKVSYSRTR